MTDTLVWDEAGTRYYETGVSKAIYFDMDMVGVVWNGLIAVNLDPQGGESEPLYFDGVKFSNKTLAEDFQASIQAINTPREFEAAEGIRPLKDSFGGKTHFNNRAKFNMCWRTEIGSDEGEAVAYKLHIAYNCVVQPSGRAYQTISDNTSPDIRTFVITATPACGRHSYFTFDSRDGDLSELEAQLYSGVLPRCYELAALTQQISGGDGGSTDPDADCDFILTDFEQFNPGQILDLEEVEVDNKDYFVTGQINNGLTITNLPATGAYAANDSAASEVGTGDILADDDDATYISSADGDLGYTVGLPSLVGYRTGAGLELHIRMSISGGVNPDDPDNLDADAQVHISTDATGDNTIGGFSDGTDEGMGFALTVVDGTPTDYVIPLNMDSWVDTDLDDVIDALIAGAYLNVVGASNNNPDTTPAVKVYEASVVVIDDTDQEKYLMAVPEDIFSVVEQHIYSSGTTDVSAANKVSIEFKFIPVPYDADADTWYQEIVFWDGDGPALLKGDVHFGGPRIELVDEDTSTSLMSFIAQIDVWYKAVIDWAWGSYTFAIYQDNERVYDPGTQLPYAIEQDTSKSPIGFVKHIGGLVSQSGAYNKSFHIVTDNAKMQIHCHEISPDLTSGVHVVDIPATILSASPGAGAEGSGWTEDSYKNKAGTPYTTFISSNQWQPTPPHAQNFTTIEKYGVGPKKFNWSLPDGATLDSMEYVFLYYREGDFAPSGTDSALITAAFGSCPADLPFPGMKSTVRSGAVAFPTPGHGVYFWINRSEVTVPEPDISAVLDDDEPFDKITAVCGDSLVANIKASYLAIRVTYTMP